MTDWPGQEVHQWPGQEERPRGQLSRQQQDQVATRAASRQFARQAAPLGLGALSQPLADLMSNPEQRAELGRSVQGALDMARQAPSLNLPRLASDTYAAGQRALTNAPGAIWNAVTHPVDLIYGMTAKPFVDEENAQQALDAARASGDGAGTQQAAQQANAATGGAITNTAGAVLGPLARTPLQGAALAAGLTAPNALANGQGSLQERLPQAVVDTAGAGAIGAALPYLARDATPREPTGAAVNIEDGVGAPHGQANRNTPAGRLRDFEAAGVRPTLAATVEGTPAGITKTISENWLGGFRARNGLQNSIEDTAARAHEMAGRVGEVQNPELAGEAVQAGVRRFAQAGDLPQPHAGDPASIPVREWSFPAKAEALYNRAFDQLERDERSMTGHMADGQPVVSVDNTLRAIGSMSDAVHGGESRSMIGAPPFLRDMHAALQTDAANGSLSFSDLRRWRTTLRERMADPGLRGDTSSSQLQSVYSALTRDINATAQNIGGQAAVDLPKIDRWYRAGSRRIETALEPFNRAGNGMGGGRQAYQRIIALASRGPQQNTQQLRALASSLRPDEMRTVGATLLDEMGNPTAGRPGALEPGAFSAASFATNWARLSEAGKSALFPPALRQELESLARVADYQREVEAMSNHSGTMRSGQNIATGAALFGANAVHAMPLALGGLAAMNLTGEMLTNPRFVRWLTHAAQARANGAGVRQSLAELRRIAARDPALLPAYNRLTQPQRASEPDRQAQLQPAQ